jgi:hypothetical protein
MSSYVFIKKGLDRSKAKAMHPEIARNQNYNDHYANNSKDVHSALLHDDGGRRARTECIRHYRHRLYPQ